MVTYQLPSLRPGVPVPEFGGAGTSVTLAPTFCGVSEKASFRNSLGTKSRRTAILGFPLVGARFNCQAICCTGTCT